VLRALARVNLAAIERNVQRLRAGLAGETKLCAVVKADASGHGAVPTARAALAGGATSLGRRHRAGGGRAARRGTDRAGTGAGGDQRRRAAGRAGRAGGGGRWSEPFVTALARAATAPGQGPREARHRDG